MKINVLVADDFPLITGALASVLEQDPGIRVCATALDGEQAVERTAEHDPDVVLLDVHMPGMSGMVALQRMLDANPNRRVVMLSASEKQDVFLEAMAIGAVGFLSKRSTPSELVQAVITVHGGGTALSPSLSTCLVQHYTSAKRGDRSALRPLLTGREDQVLRLVALGLTDREISQELYVSPRTVQNHLASVRSKTGMQRRSQLARWAADHARI